MVSNDLLYCDLICSIFASYTYTSCHFLQVSDRPEFTAIVGSLLTKASISGSAQEHEASLYEPVHTREPAAYSSVCAYRSARGKCTRVANAASELCALHTCGTEGCRLPKTSGATLCSQHEAAVAAAQEAAAAQAQQAAAQAKADRDHAARIQAEQAQRAAAQQAAGQIITRCRHLYS